MEPRLKSSPRALSISTSSSPSGDRRGAVQGHPPTAAAEAVVAKHALNRLHQGGHVNKIASGFFALTEITDHKRHVEYNWWHSSDHHPENLALEGIVLAQRWAAPRRYMEARALAHPAIAGHQYISHYLMAEPLERTLKEFHDLGARMRAIPGRFFFDRNIWMLGSHRLIKSYVAPRIVVSPEALPFRPNKGLLVVVKHAKKAEKQEEIARWHDETHIPDVLKVPGVMGCCWFQSEGEPVVGAPALGTPVNRQVFVYYLDEEPLAVVSDLRLRLEEWKAAGRILATGETMETLLAGPYENILTPEHYDWTKR